jgi:Co/Zn/Cd efflux system component
VRRCSKGVFILALAVGIVLNVIAKVHERYPAVIDLDVVFGGLALVANLVCLRLLWRFRSHDVKQVSTFECSRNDVISNVGVLVAAGAVALLNSPWPDIIIGSAMADLVPALIGARHGRCGPTTPLRLIVRFPPIADVSG